MLSVYLLMDEIEKNERISEIVQRFCDPKPLGLLGGYGSTLDINKPNFHDSKSEFLEEKVAVEKARQEAQNILDLITMRLNKPDPAAIMSERLGNYIDYSARQRLRHLPVRSASDLVRRNSAEVGLTLSTAQMLIDLSNELDKRKQELTDQEQEYWSGSSRPPNHYARTIALRFARVIANETGQRPTIGIARDGSHPSTDFGRALEEVFEILEIRANFRRAGKWAIDQLTEDDLDPPNRKMGGILGLGSQTAASGRGTLADLVRGFPKGQQK